MTDFDPDALRQPAVALLLETSQNQIELPIHQHRKGQLVIALWGAAICHVPNGMWLVAPQSGVWIPSGTPHSNRISANGRLCLLFIEPDAAQLPAECCTLSLTPLVIELIKQLASSAQTYEPASRTARLVQVLLDELVEMRAESLYLPLSADRRLRVIAQQMTQRPADRITIAEWAAQVALSERTLTRLVRQETGLSFGRWRQRLQLILALQRLSAGEPVQRISDNLGYESVSAFITMFKKALGKPPARYIAERSSNAASRHSG